MTNDIMLGSVYIVMALMLVLSALMVRREPIAKLATYALAWIAIFGAGFVLFTFRDNLGWVWQRVKSEATGEPVATGKEIRIPMAIDGHFWVEASINGEPVKFLIDSGATMTTIDLATARRAGVSVASQANQVVRTGNGFVRVASGRVEQLEVGTIQRENFGVHVTATDDLNVLGMNFLSTLNRWGVEGRWLVLSP
ncbi:TIGR02281 family clan AA aspartic protease [Sphingomonas sabuli]|uniref:TIGR02281 family clan AA aspartic protease n=1 Tax=Sphingomonas sabuli TaxID=2764186 RepID=A0A7G9L3J7_9SPHN|nr:TIGR02281 family clan AA aspartic protease [Sphingomonas sabuli]QNM83196.1 TIGR02281 family clan AA aspartic protease [Sphingomonas sabuli]